MQLSLRHRTRPIVVFNVTELPQPAVTLIESLGARVTSLEPSITVPAEFHSRRLQWPFSTKEGATVMRRFAPWAKLGVWGQTQWTKVILVDVDVVFAANVDEMGAQPAMLTSISRIYAGQRRPGGFDWMRLAEARGSLMYDQALKAASEEPCVWLMSAPPLSWSGSQPTPSRPRPATA